MKEQIIYSTSSLYRDDFRVRAYTFGEGEKSLCVVGSMRGNEYQQAFICSQIVKSMTEWEAAGRMLPGKEVMVIPSVNPSSMNMRKSFWPIDNTDINRMFPGYDLGETTQRIAAGVFEVINKYQAGVQLTSFYMPGDFSPHVRMMQTGFENPVLAEAFGLPYIVIRQPRPYDTTTLNFNWQIWETNAYSLYSNTTGRIDKAGAGLVVGGIERFLICSGVLTGSVSPAPKARVFMYDDMLTCRASAAGLYYPLVNADAHVTGGQPLGEIYDPLTGAVSETLTAPADGVVFFQHGDPVIFQHTAAVKLLPDEGSV